MCRDCKVVCIFILYKFIFESITSVCMSSVFYVISETQTPCIGLPSGQWEERKEKL